MFFLYFLALGFALGRSQHAEVSQVLGRMENTKSTLNLRLARIEARQTRNMLIYSRLENNIKDVKNDLDSKHGETMLGLKNVITVLNDLKVRDERLEAAQNTISDNLQQMINKTNECCRNDTIIVTCSNPIIVSATKRVNSSSTVNSVRTTTTASTIPAITSSTTTPTTPVPAPKDCKIVDQGGNFMVGVYWLQLSGKRSIPVYCSAGYVTIQRRFNGAVIFDRTFAEYEQGFGDVAGESWLGLAYQHELTKSDRCSLKILLDVDSNTQRNKYHCGSSYRSDCDGKVKEILADNFRVSPLLDLYRIQATWRTSDFTHPWVKKNGVYRMNGKQFSCKDQGPMRQCAMDVASPAGFWYDDPCYPGRPNSVYTKTNTQLCSSLNKVCGWWYPYYLKATWIQFRC